MSAAATLLLKQARCVRAFRAAAATTPQTAKTLDELGCRDSPLFRKMVRRGIIVACPDGRYFLNELAADEAEAGFWVTLITVSAVLVTIYLLILLARK
jgi:hypothetical protein